MTGRGLIVDELKQPWAPAPRGYACGRSGESFHEKSDPREEMDRYSSHLVL